MEPTDAFVWFANAGAVSVLHPYMFTHKRPLDELLLTSLHRNE